MIKISANISKKVPIPATEYSSQQFGAAMEIEVSGTERPEVIQSRIRELYGLLNSAVDEQISGGAQHQPTTPPVTAAPRATTPRWNTNANAQTSPAAQPPTTNGNGNGNGQKAAAKRATASEAQCRAIYAICKSMNLDMTTVLAEFNVTDASQLPIKDASRLIDELKKAGTKQQPQ